MKHELLFLCPVFHQGLNITIRNGNKWTKANVGDQLAIKETGEDQIIYTGTVVGKAYIPFKMIPNEWLGYEHDPRCRTRKGLLIHGMKPAYHDFNENNYITVLLFNI